MMDVAARARIARVAYGQIEPFGSPCEPDVDVGSRMIATTKASGLPARPLLGTRNVTNVHVGEHERQVMRGVDQLAHSRIRQGRRGADASYLRTGKLGQIVHRCGGGNRNPHRHNTDEPSQRRSPSKLRTGVLRHDDAEFVCAGEIAGHLGCAREYRGKESLVAALARFCQAFGAPGAQKPSGQALLRDAASDDRFG